MLFQRLSFLTASGTGRKGYCINHFNCFFDGNSNCLFCISDNQGRTGVWFVEALSVHSFIWSEQKLCFEDELFHKAKYVEKEVLKIGAKSN